MSFVDIKLRSERFRQAVARVPQVAEFQLTRALNDIGNAFRSHMIETRMSGPPGIAAGTGELRQSLGHHVGIGERGRQVRIGFYGPEARSARLHEYGGVVTANGSHSRCGKGIALAIPLPAAKTANLRVRMGPCEYGQYDPQTNPTGLLLIRSKKGNLILAAIQGAGKAVRRTPKPLGDTPIRDSRGRLSRGSPKPGKLVPMFVLKRSVTFRPKLGFRKTWAEFRPRAVALVRGAKDAILAAAFPGSGRL